MPGFYIVNGKYFSEDQPSISPENRSYRYGDGLFETIRMSNGKIPLWDLHMQRLYKGLQTLLIPVPKLFTEATLFKECKDLCAKNDFKSARIRLAVSRGDGGILEETKSQLHYSIQTWNLEPATPTFNTNGLHLGIYRDGIKSMDGLSNLKSNNYLVYVMAALDARERKFNDTLVLNSGHRIADSSIANIFWVKDGKIFTPPLSEGPVDGVMRNYLLQKMELIENPLDEEKLFMADELFLTNAVRGIQWVKSVEDKKYSSNTVAQSIYTRIILPLFS